MHLNSISYVQYWRNSLADADLGKGGFTKRELKGYENVPIPDFLCGQLDSRLVSSLFQNEADDAEVVKVKIRPYVYESQLSHGKHSVLGYPEIVTPIVAIAMVDRMGRILPQGHSVVPRDILEPLDRGSLSIGTVEELDAWLTTNTQPSIDCDSEHDEDEQWHRTHWSEYISFLERLTTAVTKDWPSAADHYLKASYWLLLKDDESSGASVHILPLYNHLLETNPDSSLFDRFASEEEAPAEPCLPPEAGFSKRLGHASDTYPLADAQRDAMTHHLTSQSGDILGVNGPPGTGKTTLLLSVVASHMVESAIAGGDPKLIAAASTNNQAVTNIIDAFAKDFSVGTGPFAGRWLPNIQSFGSYFPASDKEKLAATKYQTKSFFNQIENPSYFERAKSAYLKAARAALPDLSSLTVKSVVNELQVRLKSYATTLILIESRWNIMIAAQQAVINLLGSDPALGMKDIKKQIEAATNGIHAAKAAKDAWESALASEKWWMTIFSWIPAMATRRFIAAKLALKASNYSLPDTCQSLDEANRILTITIDQAQKILKSLNDQYNKAKTLIAAHQKAVDDWYISIESVIGTVQPSANITLADVDKKADTEIRFKAFLLATHYWEGRWLLAMEQLIPNIAKEKTRNGETAVKPRWLRRMMITPCMVSTFFMLPSEMKISRYDAGEFTPDYLYEFIDLLIVDEAGQVLPEVAAPSFALAKTALVIGDTLQTEPIWNTTPLIDTGNLLETNLLDHKKIQNDYSRLCRLGKTSAAGSVMLIAQNASRYHYDQHLSRGMFLYEHRRCFDEIISYSNDLCYLGKLKPMRGAAPSTATFPAMGYLHVNGKCTQPNGGSRLNLLEAETIAGWIIDNKDRLENLYKGTNFTSIDKIVGVVTPFGAQVRTIAEACTSKGLSVGKGEGQLTVGTIHSLQGAERPIVIFSPVYSKHADGKFIDRRTSMLNVAVSRAKDSFLVFGDMDIFDPNKDGEPRGLLAKYLFSRPENVLSFKHLPRHDLAHSPKHIEHLLDAKAHDAFLHKVIALASREIHIVSPWLRKRQIENSGLLSAMATATRRGVKITVYADRELNQDSNSNHWDHASSALDEANVSLVNVNRLHSKVVVKDNDILCIGSFNWLSASRIGDFARHETSLSYSGPLVAQEIQFLLNNLTARL